MATESVHQLLRRPIVTEKTALVGGNNVVVFEVHPRANKSEIKKAVEKLFEVKVESVRTVNLLGKVKRVKTKVGRRISWKKAFVQLEEGSSINLIDELYSPAGK